MSRCEDFPCCGHELGCCPDFDADGSQLNMKCVCGAPVPLSSASSLCRWCLTHDPEDPGSWDDGPANEDDTDWDDDPRDDGWDDGPEYDDPLSYSDEY